MPVRAHLHAMRPVISAIGNRRSVFLLRNCCKYPLSWKLSTRFPPLAVEFTISVISGVQQMRLRDFRNFCEMEGFRAPQIYFSAGERREKSCDLTPS